MKNGLDKALEQLVTLVKHDGPPMLKAHCIINVLLPRIIRECKCVEEIADAMGSLMARSICGWTGLCWQCKQQPVSGANEMFCVKCGAEVDQWIADVTKE